MEIIYLLVPLSMVLVIVIVYFFLWSVRNGQFDDMEGPAHRILHDDDGVHRIAQDEDTNNETG